MACLGWQVIIAVAKAGESNNDSVQLAVIKTLLTVTTAEHFLVHGDALVQAVRTVFNVAIGSDSADIQRTARNALLQMLNTTNRRVTQYPLVRARCLCSTPVQWRPWLGRMCCQAGTVTCMSSDVQM